MSTGFTQIDVDRHNAKVAKLQPASAPVEAGGEKKLLRFVITGQIRGGKNNMVVTRKGLHFPKPEWARWRDNAVALVQIQLPMNWKPIAEPVIFSLVYFAGDKRRRDMPAILDSIFHVMEKAGVVADDTLVWVSPSWRFYDKENPRAELTQIAGNI